MSPKEPKAPRGRKSEERARGHPLRLLLLALAALLLLVGIAWAAPPAPARPDRLGNVPPERVSAGGALAPMYAPRVITNPDGGLVYDRNCAACHGVSGRGNGLFADSLSAPVPDLTTLAQRNGGFDRIRLAIRIENEGAKTGTSMPCWGRVLQTGTSRNGNALVIRNLVTHIESMQSTD